MCWERDKRRRRQKYIYPSKRVAFSRLLLCSVIIKTHIYTLASYLWREAVRMREAKGASNTHNSSVGKKRSTAGSSCCPWLYIPFFLQQEQVFCFLFFFASNLPSNQRHLLLLLLLSLVAKKVQYIYYIQFHFSSGAGHHIGGRHFLLN